MEAYVNIGRDNTEGVDTRIVLVECSHSATTITFIRPPGSPIDFTDRELIVQACQRALSETSCPCVSALLLRQGHAN